MQSRSLSGSASASKAGVLQRISIEIMAVQNEVKDFFSRFEPMDDAVIDYVSDHLQQHTESTMDLVDLRCMIEGFSGNFTNLPDAERGRLIKELVEKVRVTAY